MPQSLSTQQLRVLITGGTGMIGAAFTGHLRKQGHEILTVTRKPSKPGDIAWNPTGGELDLPASGRIDAVINLAGEGIASGRWTAERKKRILESRRLGTRLLSKTIADLPHRPSVLISVSGINYYESGATAVHDENAPSGTGFLSEVCREWEEATTPARDAGIRVVILRLGMVLSPSGGALARMLPVFKLAQGGRLGSGKQRVSWIALDDVIGIMNRCLADPQCEGPLNAVAPRIVTNREFTKALGRVLHRPTPVPVPAFALRLLFGELADAALLADLAVKPRRLEELGYRFLYPELVGALKEMLAAN